MTSTVDKNLSICERMFRNLSITSDHDNDSDLSVSDHDNDSDLSIISVEMYKKFVNFVMLIKDDNPKPEDFNHLKCWKYDKKRNVYRWSD